jgi:cellulose synthase/poly-beta-1,6-N-acetylglucosamine synthase-like glycosyltransferase
MLNIITRTSGRPNFFKICKHSIRSQTYPNINHIVIIDSNNDNTYVKDYDDIDKLIDIPEGKYQHFDAYLNEALEYIPKGELFCVMDDDDFYTEKTSLQKGVDTLTDGNVVFFRVVAAGGTVPSEQMMRSSHKELVFGQLSMLGFIMSTDFTYNKDNNLIKFPPKYGGDFGFINEVITQHYADEGMYNHPQIK